VIVFLMLFFYLILAFLLFFLQNLLPFTHPMRLDLLTLLMVFLSLRAKLTISVTLALLLGLTLDCYGMAPLGLHASMLLLAVLGGKILRRRLNLNYIFPQIVGVALITIVQGMTMAVLLHLLMSTQVLNQDIVRQVLLQIGLTALSAPIVLALLDLMEKLWRRLFFIKTV
jgi:rod shape-determining protein MreD